MNTLGAQVIFTIWVAYNVRKHVNAIVMFAVRQTGRQYLFAHTRFTRQLRYAEWPTSDSPLFLCVLLFAQIADLAELSLSPRIDLLLNLIMLSWVHLKWELRR